MDRWQALASTVKKPETLVVNLYGGPGVGKSTVGALAFGLLKASGINAEYVSEYAKKMVWHERHNVLEDQIYIFAKQAHEIRHLLGKVDVIITDGPIMLSQVYAESKTLRELVRETHRTWNTMDIFLVRNDKAHPYSNKGRTQKSVGEAEQLDWQIRGVLQTWVHDFIEIKMKVTPIEMAYEVHDLVCKRLDKKL